MKAAGTAQFLGSYCKLSWALRVSRYNFSKLPGIYPLGLSFIKCTRAVSRYKVRTEAGNSHGAGIKRCAAAGIPVHLFAVSFWTAVSFKNCAEQLTFIVRVMRSIFFIMMGLSAYFYQLLYRSPLLLLWHSWSMNVSIFFVRVLWAGPAPLMSID